MKKSVIFLLFSLQISSVFAASGTLNFSGNISTTCSFSNLTSGTLAVSPLSPGQISTTTAGGSSGGVNIEYLGNPTMSVEEVQGFTTKPNGVSDSDFSYSTNVISNNGASYSGSNGYLTHQYTSGSTDTLAVNVVANKNSGNVPMGQYGTSIAIQCQ